MTAASKPSVVPTWGSSAGADAPPSGKADLGWIANERPPFNFLNWLHKTAGEWMAYLRDFEGNAHTFTKPQTFEGDAADDSPAQVFDGSITTRKLEMEYGGGPSDKVRFYRMASDGSLEITYNAKWRPSTSDWAQDHHVLLGEGGDTHTGDSLKAVIHGAGVSIYRIHLLSGDPTWTDASWELMHDLAEDGSLRFLYTGSGSNPPPSTAKKNTLCAKNTPKAWGSVRKNSGTPTLIAGFNVGEVVDGVVFGIDVNFPDAAPMSDANYAVSLTRVGEYPDDANLCVQAKTATGFRIAYMNRDGSTHSIAAEDVYADFVVFGQQNS